MILAQYVMQMKEKTKTNKKPLGVTVEDWVV